MSNQFVKSAAIMSIFALVVSLTACASNDAKSGDLQKVTLGNATTRVTAAQGPYASLPIGLGYWEDEGLDVQVLGLSGSATVVQAVDSGKIDVGTSGAGPIIVAAAKSRDIKGYYDNVTSNFAVPSVPVDSDIESVADFEGKTVGVQSLDSSTVPLVKGMVEAEGIDPNSLNFIKIGDGAAAAKFIEDGKVDVVGLSDSARSQVVNQEVDLRVVASDEYLQMGFNYPLIAKSSYIEKNRDLLIGLARGIAKAQVFVDENPEAAVRVNWEVYPESKPAGMSDEEAMKQALTILKTRMEYTKPINTLYGLATDESVQNQIKLMNLQNEVKGSDIWTADLIKEINDFDEEAIRKQAREYASK